MNNEQSHLNVCPVTYRKLTIFVVCEDSQQLLCWWCRMWCCRRWRWSKRLRYWWWCRIVPQQQLNHWLLICFVHVGDNDVLNRSIALNDVDEAADAIITDRWVCDLQLGQCRIRLQWLANHRQSCVIQLIRSNCHTHQRSIRQLQSVWSLDLSIDGNDEQW